MVQSATTAIVLGAITIVIVAICSAASCRSLYDRFGPGKSRSGYHHPDDLYEDKDGKATPESQENFSTSIPRISAFVAVCTGFLVSIACSILVTAGVTAGAVVENWLRTGAWALLLVQSLSVLIEPTPVGTWRQGVYAALSCLLIGLDLVLANTSFRNYEYADEILVALMATQLGLLIVAAAASVSIKRRPDVYYNDKPVDKENTSTFIGMVTFVWANSLISLSQKRKLDYEDLAELSWAVRARTLSERYGDAVKYTRLWKTIVWNFKNAFIIQWTLESITSLLEFVPQYAMYKLLMILERNHGSVPAVAWLYVALLGCATLLMTQINAWLFFIIWTQLGIPIRNMLSTLVFQKAMRRKDVKGAGRRKEEAEKAKAGADIETLVIDRDAGAHGEDRAVDTTKKTQKKGDDKDDDDEELEQKSRQGTINLVGVDTQRISEFAVFAYYYPGVLVKLTLSIIFLALIVGWQALTAGLIAFSITIPLNIWSSKRFTDAATRLMELRDLKLAVVTEALQGIRQIKFSALEKQWQAKIAEKREKEIATQWAAYKYDAVIIFCYIVSPVLLSAACLATYALLYGELSPSVAFTTISILSSMEGSLSVLPELTTNGIDAWISIKRIDEYLNAPEKTNCCEPADRIVFEKADIAWPADDQAYDPDRFILRNVNLAIPPKELTVISGKTGSGKSLLLASILGEVDKLAGNIYAPQPPSLDSRFDSKATKGNWIIDSAVAFVAQIPWIENATIRENILFGLPYDSGRYSATLSACALIKDVDMLDDGDATEIGHNGVNLSGGQRWRVSFARALYSRAGILVLDDIFSAVDAHVGRQLFEEALTGDLSTGRTRILVTHHVSLVLPKTQYTIHLANGTVSHAGQVEDLQKSGGLAAVLKEEDSSDGAKKSGGDGKMTSAEEQEEVEDATANGHDLSKVMSKRSQISAIIDDGGADGKRKEQAKKFVEDEKQETGAIKASVYINYLYASGGMLLWIPILFCYVAASGSEVGRSWWVSEWTRAYDTKSEVSPSTFKQSPLLLQMPYRPANQSFMHTTDSTTENTIFYLSIYIVLSFTMSLFGTVKYLATSAASIRASRILFDRLSYTVLRAPLRWLDTVPVGRILNRFTADFNVIDSYIAPHVSFFVYKIFETISITAISFVVSPTMIPLACLLLIGAGYIGYRFIGTARSTKRLENNGKSPIFELFGSALMGLSTVRGYSKADEFVERMRKRIDTHGKAYWHLWLLNRWMSYRLAMVGSIFAILVAIIIVASATEAALAGFVLSFALQYSDAIIWVLRFYANVELDMTACERVQEFSAIEIEPQTGSSVPAAWPTEGRLEVKDLVCGYAPDLPAVLKGLTFTVEKGERVGVVGRTGAGKSSLTLALFRFLEAREGSVRIDGIDVAGITLHDLRSRLAIIPQDPVLFSGTVRSNLDAFNQHSDSELRDALERVHLISSSSTNSSRPATAIASTATTALNTEANTATTSNTNTNAAAAAAAEDAEDTAALDSNTNIFNSLSSKIAEGGLNLSQGQRQLLCLARAIVARPRIMILDEATSAVDKDTDERIQRSIREEFKGSTLLVIAHRLSTIADFDRILVMGEGRGVEYGAPRELLLKGKGTGKGKDGSEGEGESEAVFRGMVEQSGEREVLESIILGSSGSAS